MCAKRLAPARRPARMGQEGPPRLIKSAGARRANVLRAHRPAEVDETNEVLQPRQRPQDHHHPHPEDVVFLE
jgi:hypothetical protein